MLDCEETTSLHDERLETVTWYLRTSGARSVLDLGCGPGALLARLVAIPQFKRIVGIDTNLQALTQAKELLGAAGENVRLLQASFIEPDYRLQGFEAAVMVETIEHVPPNRLSAVEKTVFACYRPKLVLVTTPNQEYNVIHGLPPGRLRHPGHYFEWDRGKFRQWANGIAERNGYSMYFVDIGEFDPFLGSSTQMAAFRQST